MEEVQMRLWQAETNSAGVPNGAARNEKSGMCTRREMAEE